MALLSGMDLAVSRRSFLLRGGSVLASGAVLGLGSGRLLAQEDAAATAFSFEGLVESAREMAAADYVAPETFGPPLSELNYDDYRNVQFKEASAIWAGPDANVVAHAYHPGWLFDTKVALYEVMDGTARQLQFSSEDFKYYGDSRSKMPDQFDLPGVAGFKLNAPLNAADRFDEVVSFLGASYFRALGMGNRYGLSARGLAVNTATSEAEEFPRFSAFWLERPKSGSDEVTVYALLNSQSVTGAYKFIIRPGETTTMDVTLRLFFRAEVQQLGIAPLTSMYLFGPNDRGNFDDYRARVHDSEALMIIDDFATVYRSLNNPPRLANSYFASSSPKSFGLVQRHRAFDAYLDAGAHYEDRPTLMVEPLGDWKSGTIRLIEIPSDLEANDNIVAFWVPEADYGPGDDMGLSYRLHWGMNPTPSHSELAQVSRTLAGHGGVAGVEPREDRRKFVVDFDGDSLRELDPESEVEPQVGVTGGTLEEVTLQRVEGYDRLWRMVLEISAEGASTVELRASLVVGGQRMTETWVYQWLQD